eukprot:SAG31_NODE_1585_length_7821_cov_5.615903_7_plen_106_part_00
MDNQFAFTSDGCLLLSRLLRCVPPAHMAGAAVAHDGHIMLGLNALLGPGDLLALTAAHDPTQLTPRAKHVVEYLRYPHFGLLWSTLGYLPHYLCYIWFHNTMRFS